MIEYFEGGVPHPVHYPILAGVFRLRYVVPVQKELKQINIIPVEAEKRYDGNGIKNTGSALVIFLKRGDEK